MELVSGPGKLRQREARPFAHLAEYFFFLLIVPFPELSLIKRTSEGGISVAVPGLGREENSLSALEI